MNPAVAFAVMGTIVAICVTVAEVAKHRALRVQSRDSGAEIADLSARLHRIEDALDVILIEVERSGEAQRFTSRLLVELNSPSSEAECRAH
jgi:hypothetical protein